jgi:hypothetical protein
MLRLSQGEKIIWAILIFATVATVVSRKSRRHHQQVMSGTPGELPTKKYETAPPYPV